jgi:hypothetical protein
MDCIPGLDGDELMIIMPGAFEQALKEGIEKKKKADREKLLEAGGVAADLPKELKVDPAAENADKAGGEGGEGPKVEEKKVEVVKIPPPVILPKVPEPPRK